MSAPAPISSLLNCESVSSLLQTLLRSAKQLKQMDCAQLPSDVKAWVTSYPVQTEVRFCRLITLALSSHLESWINARSYETAFHITDGVAFFFHGALAGPLLYVTGAGPTGFKAGKSSVAFQKPTTPVRALPSLKF